VKILVTLGDFEDEGVCRIVEVDLARGTAAPWLEWTPPAWIRVPAKGFTGFAWRDGRSRVEAYVCAYAALCRIDVARRVVTGILHQPSMNDLHHVAVAGDRLLLANTGADRIEAFDHGGSFLGAWDLAPTSISDARLQGSTPSREDWEAARRGGWDAPPPPLQDSPPSGDYYGGRGAPFHARRLRDFVHPNHIAIVEGRTYVTRFLDRSVQRLDDWALAIPETPGYPHDGLVDGDRFWISTTHGILVAYEIVHGLVTSREIERVDVFERTGRSGWCRGLLVTPERLVVGLTAIERMPRVRWCDRPFEATETSVLVIDRSSGRLEARVPLRDLGRKPKLFSIVGSPSP